MTDSADTMPSREEVHASTESARLLIEWFHWWHDTPTLPTQLPNALQIRTALYLYDQGIEPT